MYVNLSKVKLENIFTKTEDEEEELNKIGNKKKK